MISSVLFSEALLLLALVTSSAVHAADSNHTLVNLPHIQIQMRCSYDTRHINVTAAIEAYFLEDILPEEGISRWFILGSSHTTGQENVNPPCEYDSTKTITTAMYYGYSYLATDDVAASEQEFADLVTSDSLYEYFFRNVCQYEIENWVAVINDPTFSPTVDGSLICPRRTENNNTEITIVVSVAIAIGLMALTIVIVGYRFSRKKQNEIDN